MLGVLGVYMKRFGWSPPALLIGFVLSPRLDASVYQSIQVYGMSFLERGGVQIMLALIAVSIIVAARMKPHRESLVMEGPHAPVERRPQILFLGVLVACVVYAIYDVWELAFLGKVFPTSVALITLALLIAIAVLFRGEKPSYVFFDGERAHGGEERPVHSDLYFQGWILALLVAIAAFGFVLGIFVYILMFLRMKAAVRWHWAAVSALGAVVLFSVLGHLFVLQYPQGLLQSFFRSAVAYRLNRPVSRTRRLQTHPGPGGWPTRTTAASTPPRGV